MFIGHYAVSFAVKGFAPKASMGILVFASNFLDIIWSAYIILGIENAHIDLDRSIFAPVGFKYQAVSHSLAVSIVSSALFAGIYWWKRRDLISALVVGGAVLSHWLLDFVSYPSGLPLFPGISTNLGLGLLGSMTSSLIVEGLLLVVGVLLYLRTTKPKNDIGRYGFVAFVLLIGSAYVACSIKQIEFEERLLGGFVVFTLVAPIWAQWFDENREENETARTAWLERLTTMFMPLFSYNRNTRLEELPPPRPINESPMIIDERRPGPPPGLKEEPPIEPQAEKARWWRMIPVALLVLILLALTVVGTYVLFNKVFPGNTDRGNRNEPSAEEIKRGKIDKALAGKPQEIKSALRESANISEDVEQILLEGWEDKNVGGAIAVAISNWDSHKKYKTYKSIANLGFRRITKPESLVNRVLNNQIRIDHIELTPERDETCRNYSKFRVSITLTNLKTEPVEYYIPKGQIIEVKGSSPVWEKDYITGEPPETLSQNGAKSDKSKGDEPYSIPPADTDTIYFEAYCVDKGLALPYGPANLAIFELINTHFESPTELHDIINSIRSGTKRQETGATSLRGNKAASVVASVR